MTDYAPDKMAYEWCRFCGSHFTEKHQSDCTVMLNPSKRWDGKAVFVPFADRGGQMATIPGVNNIEVAIPPEVAQYAPDIQRFVDAMVYKLSLNAHKGRWEDRSQAVNMGLLENEVTELTEAIDRGNMVEIMLEAADVANFALIASAIAMEKK